jgi:RND family efflux transporter MFP subunit|tara:strand:- start:803 stop:1981 length:1179 start_codon:yes stop_codon:yes gene_type:complete
MMRKAVIPIVVICSALITSYFLYATTPTLQPVEPEAVATVIRVITVNPERVRLTVRSQGSVVPQMVSELIPEVSGRVYWISPALVSGGYFKQDESLLRIDDRDYRSKVDRGQATVTRAKAEDEHARFELQRIEEMAKNKLTSQSQLEAAVRAQRIAEATLKDAEIALVQAKRDLWRTEIKAPFEGLVRSEKVDIGQFVSRGQSIASIYASDSVEVRLPVADSQLAYLALPLGHRGELSPELSPGVLLTTHYGGQEYQWNGRLVRTEAEIDAKTRMVQAIVRVDNRINEGQPPLPVGLFVKAEIEGRWVEDIISLPRAAMRNGDQVLVVDKESRLRYRQVDLLRLDRDQVLIRAGLQRGEMVCISPIQTVIDGMRVKPVTAQETQEARVPDHA